MGREIHYGLLSVWKPVQREVYGPQMVIYFSYSYCLPLDAGQWSEKECWPRWGFFLQACVMLGKKTTLNLSWHK